MYSILNVYPQNTPHKYGGAGYILVLMVNCVFSDNCVGIMQLVMCNTWFLRTQTKLMNSCLLTAWDHQETICQISNFIWLMFHKWWWSNCSGLLEVAICHLGSWEHKISNANTVTYWKLYPLFNHTHIPTHPHTTPHTPPTHPHSHPHTELLWSFKGYFLGQSSWTHMWDGVPDLWPLCGRMQPLCLGGGPHQYRRAAAVCHRGRWQYTECFTELYKILVAVAELSFWVL